MISAAVSWLSESFQTPTVGVSGGSQGSFLTPMPPMMPIHGPSQVAPAMVHSPQLSRGFEPRPPPGIVEPPPLPGQVGRWKWVEDAPMMPQAAPHPPMRIPPSQTWRDDPRSAGSISATLTNVPRAGSPQASRSSRSASSISAPVTNMPRCRSPGALRSSSIHASRASQLLHQGSISVPLRPHASRPGVDRPSRLMTPGYPDHPSSIRAATPIPVREDIPQGFLNGQRSLTNMLAPDPWPVLSPATIRRDLRVDSHWQPVVQGTPPASVLTPPPTQFLSAVPMPAYAANQAVSASIGYQPSGFAVPLGVPVGFHTPASSSQSVPLAASSVLLGKPGQTPLAPTRIIRGSADPQRLLSPCLAREDADFSPPTPEVCEVLQLSPRLQVKLGQTSARIAEALANPVEGADWVQPATSLRNFTEAVTYSDLSQLVPTTQDGGAPQMLPSADYAIVSPWATLPSSVTLSPIKPSDWASQVNASTVSAEVLTHSDQVAQSPTVQDGAVPRMPPSNASWAQPVTDPNSLAEVRNQFDLVAQSPTIQDRAVPQMRPCSAGWVQPESEPKFDSSAEVRTHSDQVAQLPTSQGGVVIQSLPSAAACAQLNSGSTAGAFGGSFGFQTLQANLGATAAGLAVPADMQVPAGIPVPAGVPVTAGMQMPAGSLLDQVSPPSSSSLVQDLQELKAMIGGLKVATPPEQRANPSEQQALPYDASLLSIYDRQDAKTVSIAALSSNTTGAGPFTPSFPPSAVVRPPTSMGIARVDVGALPTGTWRPAGTSLLPGSSDMEGAISVAYSSGAWRSNGSGAYNVVEMARTAERPTTEDTVVDPPQRSYHGSLTPWQITVSNEVPSNPDTGSVSVNRLIYDRYNQQVPQAQSLPKTDYGPQSLGEPGRPSIFPWNDSQQLLVASQLQTEYPTPAGSVRNSSG